MTDTPNWKLASKKSDNLLEGASQHVLSELLGYDEGRAYYFILNCKDEHLKKEYSYSKRYRILKDLFEKGVTGKLKQEGKDFYIYFPLPPTFLRLHNINNEVVEYLEGLYLKNYRNIYNAEFLHIMLKEDNGLILFFLKYLVKNYAKILTYESTLNKYIDSENIEIRVNCSNGNKKSGVIDGLIGFEINCIIDKKSNKYMGCIINKTENGMLNCCINQIEKEFDKTS